MRESGECSLIYMYIQGGSNMTGTDLCVNKPHKSRSYLNHPVHSVANNAMLQLCLLHDFHKIVLIIKHKSYPASGSVLLPNVKHSRCAPSLATATESSSNHVQECRMASLLLLAWYKYHS
jgi:hypothetical protein